MQLKTSVPSVPCVTAILILLLTAPTSAQEAFLAPGDVDMDFLFNYYDQDGDRSPVTGGIGTEDMQVGSTVILMRHRLNDDWQMSYQLGADSITSASVDAIDFDVSSASRQDTRVFALVTGTRRSGDNTFRLSGGFSNEYDYQSASFGAGWSRELNQGNSTFSVDLHHYADNVELYDIDGEVQGDDARSTTDVSLGWTQVLGKNTLLSAEIYVSEQSGFLSTPFHEVILADGTRVAERLPDARSRQALGLWLNHAFSRRFVLRSHVRAYDDDWGIQALTASLEPHVKISSERSIWVFPILRVHDQDAADHYGPPGLFTLDDPYFTADPDLGEFSSEKFGLGFSWRADPARSGRRWLRSFETRVTRYERDDGFEAMSLSLAFGLRF